MPREKESYRDILDDLNTAFPNGCMLKAKEVSAYTGLDPRTVTKYFNINKHVGINKCVLARKLAGGN